MVRSTPPENEIPVALPWSVVLGRGEDVVAALIGVRVYTTGVELDLVARGGSMFGPNSAAMRYFLTPLPPPGPVVVHFVWPALDLPESSVELDGGQIAAVVPGVEVLWPPEPPPPPLRPEPEPGLDVPEDGWFGRALRGLPEPPAS